MKRIESVTGKIGAIWGVSGVILLLGSAVYRLAHTAAAAFSPDLFWYHKLALFAGVIVMAYAEGFKAFHKGFSPRVVARAVYLVRNPTLTRVLFAPLFCMGFFHATKRRQITAISVALGIVIVILIVRLLPQPWQGIIDAGVVVGLSWGVVSMLFFSIEAIRTGRLDFPPEIPEA